MIQINLISALWIFILSWREILISGAENVTCDFEVDWCGWQRLPSSNFDWHMISGPTPDRASGPDNDHTIGNATGRYLYINSREARHSNWVATLGTNITSSTEHFMEFWYHMNGNGIGSLSVVTDDGVPHVIWTRRRRQGGEWRKGSLTIPSGSYMLIFSATSRSHIGGDIGIDDIKLSDVSTSTSFVPTTPAAPETDTFPFSCDFESNVCGMKQSSPYYSSVRWVSLAGSLSYGNKTYIDAQQSSLRGHYLLLKAEKESLNGDSARLILPGMATGNTSACFAMSYIMPTSQSGSISVYKKFADDTLHLMDEISGYKGNDWKIIYFSIPPSEQLTIIIEGIYSGDFHSVVAIDDVNVTAGQCIDYTTKPSTTPTPTTHTIPPVTITHDACAMNQAKLIPELVCAFDKDSCSFNKSSSSHWFSLSWSITNITYPNVTSGDMTTAGNHYIHSNADSWTAGKNSSAFLTSLEIDGRDLCFQFDYLLMHTSSSLSVLIENEEHKQEIIWTAPNTTIKTWIKENININFPGKIKIIYKSTKFTSKDIVGLDNIKGFNSNKDISTSSVPTEEIETTDMTMSTLSTKSPSTSSSITQAMASTSQETEQPNSSTHEMITTANEVTSMLSSNLSSTSLSATRFMSSVSPTIVVSTATRRTTPVTSSNAYTMSNYKTSSPIILPSLLTSLSQSIKYSTTSISRASKITTSSPAYPRSSQVTISYTKSTAAKENVNQYSVHGPPSSTTKITIGVTVPVVSSIIFAIVLYVYYQKRNTNSKVSDPQNTNGVDVGKVKSGATIEMTASLSGSYRMIDN